MDEYRRDVTSMDQAVLMQYFDWHLPADGMHWRRLRDDAAHLADIGISAVWLPPCTKAINGDDVGYGPYDLYDLGEFDQKGTVRTKYGTKAELLEAIAALHAHQIKVYADVVLNHKAGADETERFTVVRVDPQNRRRIISDQLEIEGWTLFAYKGRQQQYSDFIWNWKHFTATDFDQATGEQAIFQIVCEDKNWSDAVDDEFGNYDYLMYANVDYHHPDVIAETLRWGKWFVETLNLDGMRLDAIKHINEDFIEDFVKTLRAGAGRDFYVVGEYWHGNTAVLRRYLENTNYHLALFDVSLHFHFHEASHKGHAYDLRRIFDHTLVAGHPHNVMTFVDNHDTQIEQSLASWVEDWFKPIAYALILLRFDGYPCVFYGDYYGLSGSGLSGVHRQLLDKLLYVRTHFAYGEQVDRFDHPNVIAWQRLGDTAHPGSGLAVLVSNGEQGYKTLSFGSAWAGTTWVDHTGHIDEMVRLNEDGQGVFRVSARSVSTWIPQPLS
jgi:alpha-amylase